MVEKNVNITLLIINRTRVNSNLMVENAKKPIVLAIIAFKKKRKNTSNSLIIIF